MDVSTKTAPVDVTDPHKRQFMSVVKVADEPAIMPYAFWPKTPESFVDMEQLKPPEAKMFRRHGR